MAIYRQGQASMDAQGYVTGYDTKWREQLTLIRPGATIFFLSEQLQAAVITEVINDTSIRAISTGGVEVPRTNYIILLHDSLTVDGLAQDVAETLRYYQGKEAVIEEAIEFFKTFKDWDRVNEIMQQFKEYSDSAKNSAQSAEQSKNEATLQAQNSAQSASQANTAKDQANAANQSAQQAKADAEEASRVAQAAKDEARQNADAAKGYRDQAEAAKNEANTAKDQAVIANQGAQSAKDAAEKANEATQGVKDQVAHYIGEAKDYSDKAQASSESAKQNADAASAANQSAQQAKNEANQANESAQGAKVDAANSAEEAKRYLDQAQTIASDGIGLANKPRDCPDISGNPSAYLGFIRIRENVPGWPSIASGEAYLAGYIQCNDGSPSYVGLFQGWGSRSLYTYRWAANIGPQWTRHARKDEISRLVQGSGETALRSAGGKQKFVLLDGGTGESLDWGVYDNAAGKWKALGVGQGGTGGINAGQARTNLQVFHESWDNLGQKDLDTLTGEYSGLYFNGLSADCTPERHYPEKTAGALKIIRNRANGNSGCSQYYYPFNTNDRYYSRWFNAADRVWTAWNEWRRPSDNDSFRDLIGLGRNNVRDFLTLALRSNYSQPLSIASAHPTIRFDETDRPSGSPLYEFVFDGGNWRIQKGGEGFKGEYVISYGYREDAVTIPKLSVGELSVNDIFVPTPRLQGVKDRLLIPNTGLTRRFDYNAPAGAEKGKYYPVIISQPPGWNGDAFVEVSMRTRSLSGRDEPNCNLIHMWIRGAGWSDMGHGAFGHYHAYDSREVAISCIRGTDKGQFPHNAIYVRGDAFPIRLSATVGCTITIPTGDWRPSTANDSPIYKWGITAANDGVGGDFGCSNLLDFSKGRTGFYSNNMFVDGGGNKYLRDGLGDGGTITLDIANLVNKGKITAQKGIATIENSDWDMLAVSSDMTMKPVSGSSGAPSSGTAVGFSISHNIDSSAQLSFYNNGAYFRTGDPTNPGDWTKLSSEKFVTDKLRNYMTQSELTNALESGNYGGNFYPLTGNEAFYLWRLGTTTAGANMYLDPNPAVSQVLRSTSSSRYKRSIETLVDDHADLMLNMRPVWYRSTCENDREDWGWYGLIAEEVGEVAPEYVHWRPLQEGEDPAIASSNGMVAEGVMYERLTVPLIHHVKNLKTENEEMRKEIADLKNSIDELKAVVEALVNKPATLN